MSRIGFPEKQGLYDPINEKDACGVGFIANINGDSSHKIVKNGLEILKNMEHRGAVGADPKTGDGAGILTQLPDDFFRIFCSNDGVDLPEKGKYGVGMMFLPRETASRLQCEGITERIVREAGYKTLGWRFVPTDNSSLGETAKGTEPVIRQVFIANIKNIDQDAFERDLYLIRKRTEKEVNELLTKDSEYFYITSMSARTIVYKGLLLADQIANYYTDLTDINFKSAMALVHQRFSTNTFPTWDLAQPFRFLAHNGEINTLKGNINWMNTREGVIKSEVFGENLKDLYPIIKIGQSDSASLDNAFEFIRQNGRTNAHTAMMLIPEAWENDKNISVEKRAFYEYHASMCEPWDGPAAVLFCDGIQIGGTLDRNGLRPAKYVITKEGTVIMASEFGVIHYEADEIKTKGRLKPGEMLIVDTEKKKVLMDEEIKMNEALKYDYISITDRKRIRIEDIDSVPAEEKETDSEELLKKQITFGYSMEDMRLILKQMSENGSEPLGSMGNDTPLAVLSDKPQILYNYFKQLFAQVTNPPIDPIREGVVMSLQNFIGSETDILSRDINESKYILLNEPILNNSDMQKIKRLDNDAFKSVVIDITFKADGGIQAFEKALDSVCEKALEKSKEGYNIIILSDKNVDQENAPVPSLLAVSAVHHHMIRNKQRSSVSIIIESGDSRETFHFAQLIGFGATAVNPYMAIDSITAMTKDNTIECLDVEESVEHYLKAAHKGVKKILTKMGICTIQSYHGAQIFECLGLEEEFIDKYFSGTATRIGGIGIKEIAQEALMKHRKAYYPEIRNRDLDAGGLYKWRKDGEYHLFNPDTIYRLQQAVRTGDYEKFKEYTSLIDDQRNNPCTLRGLLKFRNKSPIPIEEVEPESEIIKRFCSGAMSIGSISREAHETIAMAMNKLGAKSNSGEGGEDVLRLGTEDKNSAIKQVASGRFGVTMEYLASADELQIKIAQGAKPGEGGHLPGKKVTEYIGSIRHSLPGIDLISPPPHHDIYSIEDLAQLIFDLKNSNTGANISVKLVSESGVGTVAAGVAKAHADVILISGYDGGTGASPISSIMNTGIPWEIGLSETHQVLLLNNLRSRVRIQTDGQLKTGKDVVVAALLGAEEFGFATSVLVTLGCVMLRHCQNNNCEMGVATQCEELRANFKGKPEYVMNFMKFIAREVREHMAELGFRTVNEMIGRVDKLEKNTEISHWKASKVDLSKILYKPDMPKRITPYCSQSQNHGLETSLDNILIKNSEAFFRDKRKVEGSFDIRNLHRTVGTMISGKIAKAFPGEILEDDTLKFKFYGSAGQSFGAYGIKGLTLEIEGDVNDYVGKGLSGAKLIIKKPENADFEGGIIAGNTILYGATSGEVYFNGVVGERFCVRNSGVEAVVEGVGNHGCEYMTAGFVTILGDIGRNFAAGMSGGTAVIYDKNKCVEKNCNMEMVLIEKPTDANMEKAKEMIEKHYKYTNSKIAGEILENWEEESRHFIRVIPETYKQLTEGNEYNRKVS